MKVWKYEEFIRQHAFIPLSNLGYSFTGLAGEVGECMEWFKKSHYRDNPKYTDDMLKKEIGDVIHYATRISLEKGWSLKEVMQANMDKLEERVASAK